MGTSFFIRACACAFTLVPVRGIPQTHSSVSGDSTKVRLEEMTRESWLHCAAGGNALRRGEFRLFDVEKLFILHVIESSLKKLPLEFRLMS